MEARARIMQIHARKMTVDPDVNFEEISKFIDNVLKQKTSKVLEFESF